MNKSNISSPSPRSKVYALSIEQTTKDITQESLLRLLALVFLIVSIFIYSNSVGATVETTVGVSGDAKGCAGCEAIDSAKASLAKAQSIPAKQQAAALKQAAQTVKSLPLKHGRMTPEQIKAVTQLLLVAKKIDPINTIMDWNLTLFRVHQNEFRKEFNKLKDADRDALMQDLEITLSTGNDSLPESSPTPLPTPSSTLNKDSGEK